MDTIYKISFGIVLGFAVGGFGTFLYMLVIVICKKYNIKL